MIHLNWRYSLTIYKSIGKLVNLQNLLSAIYWIIYGYICYILKAILMCG